MHQKKSAKIHATLIRGYDQDVNSIQQIQEDTETLQRHCTTLDSSLCEETSRNSECNSHIKELREILASCNNLNAKSHQDGQKEKNVASTRMENEEIVENHPSPNNSSSGMEEMN
ncbi:unnamed protein product [Cylicocyclus nassatus]|uniref:Uncharacterized protein n=1 Tax=Cylicocyclus nassatus TaxID=53992 RepID=A0AA36MCY7_CYLNA|nr:unnamed protein product [Cylicocyclus nassatus]